MTERRCNLFPPALRLLLLTVLLCCNNRLHAAPPPRRIVSLSPSVTEILFALGQGPRVVGVSRYCDYPEAATDLPRVGGLVDPDYEAIVILHPDLVILLSSQTAARRELRKLGLHVLSVPHRSLEDVHEAIRLVGQVCGVAQRAGKLVDRLTRRVRRVHRAVAGLSRPRVLVCIGRSPSSPRSGPVTVAGRDGFYDPIIRLAGGENACRDRRVHFPQLSAEGVIRLNPDVIVDLVNIRGGPASPRKTIAAQWSVLPGVAAVRTGRVYVLTGTRALRPGPRYPEFLRQLAELLHPRAAFLESRP